MAGSILRVSHLEKRAELQHRKTEEAEHAMRDLSHRLVQAQEEERRSLSRELHDQVGQILTALRIELGNLEQLRSRNGGGFEDHMREAKQLAEKTLGTVRDMAMGLRPSMLDDLGLGPALEWQARNFSRRTGVPVAVTWMAMSAKSRKRIVPAFTALYRKHYQLRPSCASCQHPDTLHGSEGLLSLTVKDDGIGFTPGAGAARSGIGLLGIEERVRELGGTMCVESQPMNGMSLSVEIPVSAGVNA